MSIKEQYWKYSLIVIILFMGIIIFRQITPFLGGLLGALTIYILVRTQMTHLTEKWKLKRSVAALLITAETVMVFLVPLGLTIWLLVNQLQDINLDPQTFIAPMQQVAEFIKEKTGYDVLGKDTLSFIVSILPRIGQIIMESISSLAINLFVMVFVLYFMLIGGKKMEAYVNDILPSYLRSTQCPGIGIPDLLRHHHSNGRNCLDMVSRSCLSCRNRRLVQRYRTRRIRWNSHISVG